MVDKSLLDSLKASFKKGFRQRIKKAETLESVISILEKKQKKLKLKLQETEDEKILKRMKSQLAIIELQINKAQEQMKKSNHELKRDLDIN